MPGTVRQWGAELTLNDIAGTTVPVLSGVAPAWVPGLYWIANGSGLPAPSLATAASGGAVTAGTYQGVITYVNPWGETLASASASIAVSGTLAPPAAPTVTASGTGSTVTAGTYQGVITYVNAAGETVGSASFSVTTTAGQNIVFTSPAASGNATGWYAYITQAGGALGTATRQQAAGSPTAIGTGLTLTANPTNTGATAPASNTAYSSTLTVNAPPANGPATGWYAYLTVAGGGTYYRQQAAGSPTAIGTSLTLTANPTTTGANPPASSPLTVLDWNGSSWVTTPAPGSRYLALLIADPSTSGPSGGPAVNVADLFEDTTTGYARQPVAFSTATPGPPAGLSNSGTLTFGPYTANQAAPVKWAALVTSLSGTSGLLLYTWNLDTLEQVSVSQSIIFPPGTLSLGQQ